MNKNYTTLHILDMAPTTITSRSTLLPRPRRSAATDTTTTTSSGVATSTTPTAGTRPLCDLSENDAADARETTAKRISRRTLDRRLRRLGRKLSTVMIMFDDVAKAAQIDTIEKKTKTGRRGSRAGRNARRRHEGFSTSHVFDHFLHVISMHASSLRSSHLSSSSSRH